MIVIKIIFLQNKKPPDNFILIRINRSNLQQYSTNEIICGERYFVIRKTKHFWSRLENLLIEILKSILFNEEVRHNNKFIFTVSIVFKKMSLLYFYFKFKIKNEEKKINNLLK
jgi:hypothetical protein